jgi:hypothetical protein
VGSDFAAVVTASNIRDVHTIVPIGPAAGSRYTQSTTVAVTLDEAFTDANWNQTGRTIYVDLDRRSATTPWLMISVGNAGP